MPKPPLKAILISKPPSRIYSEEQKREAVVLHFNLGTQEAVSKALGIPQRTISDWERSEWWKDLKAQLIAECKDEQGAGWRELVKKSQVALLDRVTHGDKYLTAGGKERRKPIPAKELAVIAAIATDKDRILRGEPTSISARTTNLQATAKEFEDIAQGKDKGAA